MLRLVWDGISERYGTGPVVFLEHVMKCCLSRREEEVLTTGQLSYT